MKKLADSIRVMAPVLHSFGWLLSSPTIQISQMRIIKPLKFQQADDCFGCITDIWS
jgi:hypothetical protein